MNKMRVRLSTTVGWCFLFSAFISGCAGLKSKEELAMQAPAGEINPMQAPAIVPPEMTDNKSTSQASAPTVKSYAEIPYSHNRYVDQWIEYFQGRGRKYMDVYLERSTRYLPLMKGVLKQNGLPEDLVYVPLIESGFSPKAVSNASAVGYWQFIRGTGKRYGLRIDSLVDDRRDPLLASQAAVEYFKELYGMFGDWYLSLAAYNVGEGRVKRATAKHGTKDFWELIQKRRAIPRETVNYVPKFLAARIIYKNPQAYGFHKVDFQPQLQYDIVEVKEPISLIKLADAMKITFEDLQSLNPRFRSDYVPVYDNEGPTRIRVPREMMSAAYAALPQALSDKPTWVAQDFFIYKVRSGDTLSTIARRHGTRIAVILDLNNLSRRAMIRVGQRLKIPETSPKLNARGASRREQSLISRKKVARIASNSTSSRAGARGESRTIKLPRVLPAKKRIFADEGRTVASRGAATTKRARTAGLTTAAVSKLNPKMHNVRRGENLTMIARKYGVTVQALKTTNNLKNRTVLKAGQRLKIAQK